jgi:hypothetical protein
MVIFDRKIGVFLFTFSLSRNFFSQKKIKNLPKFTQKSPKIAQKSPKIAQNCSKISQNSPIFTYFTYKKTPQICARNGTLGSDGRRFVAIFGAFLPFFGCF